MASFDHRVIHRLFGAGATAGQERAVPWRGLGTGWPARLRPSPPVRQAVGSPQGGWSWSERVAPCGVPDVRFQHHKLGGVSQGMSCRCRATGWGMIVSGKATLEMRQEHDGPARYDRLEAGDVWSVPASASAWFQCGENEQASVVAFIGGREPGGMGIPDGMSGACPSAETSFSHRFAEQKAELTAWGRQRVVEAHAFSDPDALSAALVEIEPGRSTDLHWHLNASVWQICLDGAGSVSHFPAGRRHHVSVLQEGTVTHVGRGEGHLVHNDGCGTLRLLEIFRSDHYHDLSLPQWLATASPEAIADHLCLDVSLIAGLAATQERRAR